MVLPAVQAATASSTEMANIALVIQIITSGPPLGRQQAPPIRDAFTAPAFRHYIPRAVDLWRSADSQAARGASGRSARVPAPPLDGRARTSGECASPDTAAPS